MGLKEDAGLGLLGWVRGWFWVMVIVMVVAVVRGRTHVRGRIGRIGRVGVRMEVGVVVMRRNMRGGMMSDRAIE